MPTKSSGGGKPPPKQTSPAISSLAARVMNGSVKPTAAQTRSMAASLVGQDQTRGQAPKKR